MTKNQLINILSKRAEVVDKDSLLFFEDFIKIFSEKIAEGEVHFLRGVGHFYSCRGTLVDETIYEESKSLTASGKKIKLVLFHETLEFIDDLYKALVVIPPDEVLFKSENEEEYFSLSFGKPVIAFAEKAEDFQVTDHIRNLGIKATRIIKEMEYLDKRKVEEEIKVLKRKSLKLGPDNTEKSDEVNSKSRENTEGGINSSETGKGKYSGRDSANSSAFDLYYHSKLSQKNRDDRGLPWDYSREIFGRQPDRTGSSDSKKDKKEDNKAVKKLNIENKNTESKTNPFESRLTDSDSFKRVKNVINDTTKESTFVNQSGELSQKKIIEFNKVPPSPEEFSEVKAKNKKLDSVSDKDGSELESIFKESIKKDSRIDKEPFAIKRRRIISMAAVLFTIIFIVAIAYLIIESGILFPSDENENNVVAVQRPPSVEVIERNDLIPVTYPYEKQPEQKTVTGISPDAFKVEKDKIVDSKNNTQQPEIKKENIPLVIEKKPEIIPDTKKEKITSTLSTEPEIETENTSHSIFRYNDYFVVQVGIYTTYSVADAEAEKFRNMGYNALVEMTQVAGETRYRLRVGDFTSERQADRFSRKYKQ